MGDPTDGSSSTAPPSGIPITAEELRATPQWATTEAKAEDKNWDSLDHVRKENDTQWLRLYGKLLLVVTLVFTLVFLGSLLVWAWHYLAPRCWQWLEPGQLGKIQSVLFSGGMGAVVSNIIRTQISKA
ncbi:hypothetical protein [Stenotrophomonas sp. 278]|uniref:hypothetical protein n=1 Tax=Stenotrophomonas sp. 278 TaxID=2479851 RepID=UPI000F65A0D4|nr:hypothetical protein [Stenotrophomonas sp. 278]RRT96760.1 hypothetical protein EGJ34_21580 [Stenotrophomonas sp. 278]